MMMRLVTISAALLISTSAFAETKMDIKDVPTNVQAMFQHIANNRGAKLDEVQLDMDDGVPIYEFKTTGSDGRKAEIDIKADGSLDEIEEVIAANEVPAPVMETVNRVVAGFAPSKMERSLRPTGIVVYEFDGKDNRGAEVDVDVSPNGKSIFIADDVGN